jgi:hypothetical protein
MSLMAELNTGFAPEDDLPLVVASPGSAYRHETYNLWGYDPTERVGVHMHLTAAGGDFANFNATVVVFDGEDIYAREFSAKAQKHGLSGENVFVTCIEPLKLWRYEFMGLLARMNPASSQTASFEEAPKESVAFDVEVESASPPVEQGSQGDDGVHASTGTVVRVASRYEQLAHIRGSLRIGERRLNLHALGMRVHRRNSTNMRETGTVGHSWATGLFPSGRGFHALAYMHPPEGKPGFLCGIYYDGKAHHPAEVLKFPYFSGRTDPEPYEIVLRVGGETLKIQGLPVPPYLRRFSRATMVDVGFSRAPGRFLLDGEVGGGLLDGSLHSDYPAGGHFEA